MVHATRSEVGQVLKFLQHTNAGEHGRCFAGLTEDEILAQAILFFMAGYDTTAGAISFLCYNLALNQHCQDTLIEEIDTVMEGQVSAISVTRFKVCKTSNFGSACSMLVA